MGVDEENENDYGKLEKKNKLYVTIITILSVFLILSVMFSCAVLYRLYEYYNEENDDDGPAEYNWKFRIELVQNQKERLLIIHHNGGDPAKLADFRIDIINKSDESNKLTIDCLYGSLLHGSSITITNITCKAMTIYSSALSSFDLSVGIEYQVDLRGIKDHFKFSYDVICTSEKQYF